MRLKIAKGRRPPVRGGNGTPMPPAQARLLAALGPDWRAELVVATGVKAPGVPTCYKLDIGHRRWQIGIEVDGTGHNTDRRRAEDARKTAFLEARGWTVLRFTNDAVLRQDVQALAASINQALPR